MSCCADWLVVLDLHGTVVDCDEDVDVPKARPFLQPFLQFLFSHVKAVGIWTAASKSTLENIYRLILRPMLPFGCEFVFIWHGDRVSLSRPRLSSYQLESRSSSTDAFYRNPLRQKRLSKIWRTKQLAYKLNISRHNIIILEDTWSMCEYNWGNSVLVPRYEGDSSDEMLKRLSDICFPQWISRYNMQNKHIFESYGFNDYIIACIHSFTPMHSVRFIDKTC